MQTGDDPCAVHEVLVLRDSGYAHAGTLPKNIIAETEVTAGVTHASGYPLSLLRRACPISANASGAV